MAGCPLFPFFVHIYIPRVNPRVRDMARCMFLAWHINECAATTVDSKDTPFRISKKRIWKRKPPTGRDFDRKNSPTNPIQYAHNPSPFYIHICYPHRIFQQLNVFTPIKYVYHIHTHKMYSALFLIYNARIHINLNQAKEGLLLCTTTPSVYTR